MYTIIETPTFEEAAREIWSEDERGQFCLWLASNLEAGSVIPGSGGCRKVRWSMQGVGKRGGARVIYFNRLPDGSIWLLMIYRKRVRGNIPAHILREVREEIESEG